MTNHALASFSANQRLRSSLNTCFGIRAASISVGIVAIKLAIVLVAIPAALARASAKLQQVCKNRSQIPTVEWLVPHHPV